MFWGALFRVAYDASGHPGGMQDISRGLSPPEPAKIALHPGGVREGWRWPTRSNPYVLDASEFARPRCFRHQSPFALIDPVWQERLHTFLGGSVRHIDAVPEAIGGMADHVHLLVGLKATHCLADMVRDLKRASSKWVHENTRVSEFAWQDGYGAFTVSASDREAVCKYINQQAEHHRKRTFQEEYVLFLRRCGVEYDERYLD